MDKIAVQFMTHKDSYWPLDILAPDIRLARWVATEGREKVRLLASSPT